MTDSNRALAEVIYRANRADRTEVTMHLDLAPEAATVADAWARLQAVHHDIDPLSLEIEVHETAHA